MWALEEDASESGLMHDVDEIYSDDGHSATPPAVEMFENNKKNNQGMLIMTPQKPCGGFGSIFCAVSVESSGTGGPSQPGLSVCTTAGGSPHVSTLDDNLSTPVSVRFIENLAAHKDEEITQEPT